MPLEVFEMDDVDKDATWKMKAAAVWISLVTVAYIGTIVMERGERIMRIFESLTN